MDDFAELESDFSVHVLQLWELCEEALKNKTLHLSVVQFKDDFKMLIWKGRQ